MTLGPLSEKDAADVERLCDAILGAMNEEAERQSYTVGAALTALFHLFVESAKASDSYNPKQLIKDVDERIRQSVGLQ